MAQTEIPKLFINADPGGANLAGAQREFSRSWANQTEVSVPGIHYLQEDSPDLIGAAISLWFAKAVRGDAQPRDDARSERNETDDS